MSKFQGKDGTAQSALSIVQSRLGFCLSGVIIGVWGVFANVCWCVVREF